MLETLRKIVQEVTAAADLHQALNLIVRRVKLVMNTDVCCIFLSDQLQSQYVLMATDGLNPRAAGQVRIDFNQGLVGKVAKLGEPVNIDDAQHHPDYLFLPETGEENYHGFLGVPIVHHGEVLGVITVLQTKKRSFIEAELTLLVTIAAQLAGVIAHAEAVGEISGLHGKRINPDKPFKGLPGAPGVAIGHSVVLYPTADLEAVPNRKTDNIEDEISVFITAISHTREDLLACKKQIAELPIEDQALFDAYLLILDSKNLSQKTIDRIKQGYCASAALRDTVLEHVKLFTSMDDAYLGERAQDIRDLGKRILMHIQSSSPNLVTYHEKTILVGDELTAPALMEVPKDKLSAIVSTSGSSSSHVAILARAMGIPAVMGATDLPTNQVDGKTFVVDGYQGNVYIEPSHSIINEFKHIVDAEKALLKELEGLKNLPSETTDGCRIPLYINSGLASDLTSSQNTNAEGVGLYRTEFPFMIRDRFPGEEEQTQIYRKILRNFAPRPVVLRTLDIGGDKALSYFPINEDNPFLGWRGIRVSLDHPDIFITQLKAMLRASIGLDNLHILLPMISCVAEVNTALKLIKKARTELLEEGFTNINMPQIGAMIEVPAAVYQTNIIAKRVDFISIGTNDLVQYILAVDRNNPNVASLYDCLHPSVIQAVKQVVRQAERHNTPVSICGEMAGDPVAAILLLGMGLSNFSMNTESLLKIKWVIRSFSVTQAQQLLMEVEHFEEASEVRLHLTKALEAAGLGALIHPGKH